RPPRPRSTLFPYTTLFRSFRKTRPAAARLVLVGAGEQRLAGDDIDIDARLLVEEIVAGPGHLRPALLRYAVLLGRKVGNGLFGLDRKSTRLNSSHVKISYA